jgi:predicted HTH transcriptional regulator
MGGQRKRLCNRFGSIPYDIRLNKVCVYEKSLTFMSRISGFKEMEKQELILNYLKNNNLSSSKEIFEGRNALIGYATVKRCISILLSEAYITRQGNSKTSRYALSPRYKLFYPVDLTLPLINLGGCIIAGV